MRKIFFSMLIVFGFTVSNLNAAANSAWSIAIVSEGANAEYIYNKNITDGDHYGNGLSRVYVYGDYSNHDLLRTWIGTSMGNVVQETFLGYTSDNQMVTEVYFQHYGIIQNSYLQVKVLPEDKTLEYRVYVR